MKGYAQTWTSLQTAKIPPGFIIRSACEFTVISTLTWEHCISAVYVCVCVCVCVCVSRLTQLSINYTQTHHLDTLWQILVITCLYYNNPHNDNSWPTDLTLRPSRYINNSCSCNLWQCDGQGAWMVPGPWSRLMVLYYHSFFYYTHRWHVKNNYPF